MSAEQTPSAEVQAVRQDLDTLAYNLDAFSAYVRQELAKSQDVLRRAAQVLPRRK